jgi:MFS family permease
VNTFHLGASDLGLLTSVYFLAFALFQPLLGVLLDRFGPRRVEGLLAAVAMVAGHMTVGNMASRLERAGIAPSYVVGIGVGASVLVQAAALFWFFLRMSPGRGMDRLCLPSSVHRENRSVVH